MNLYFVISVFSVFYLAHCDDYKPDKEDCQIKPDLFYSAKYKIKIDSEEKTLFEYGSMETYKDTIFSLLNDKISGYALQKPAPPGEIFFHPQPLNIKYNEASLKITECSKLSQAENDKRYKESLRETALKNLIDLDQWEFSSQPQSEIICYKNPQEKNTEVCFRDMHQRCSLTSYKTDKVEINIDMNDFDHMTPEDYQTNFNLKIIKCKFEESDWKTGIDFHEMEKANFKIFVREKPFDERSAQTKIFEIEADLDLFPKYSYLTEDVKGNLTQYFNDYESGLRFKRKLFGDSPGIDCEVEKIQHSGKINTMREFAMKDLKNKIFGELLSDPEGKYYVLSSYSNTGRTIVLKASNYRLHDLVYEGVMIVLDGDISTQDPKKIRPVSWQLVKDGLVDRINVPRNKGLLMESELKKQVAYFDGAACHTNEFSPRLHLDLKINDTIGIELYKNRLLDFTLSLRNSLSQHIDDDNEKAIHFSATRMSAPFIHFEESKVKKQDSFAKVSFSLYELPSDIEIFFKHPLLNRTSEKITNQDTKMPSASFERCVRMCYDPVAAGIRLKDTCYSLVYDMIEKMCYFGNELIDETETHTVTDDKSVMTTTILYRDLHRQRPTVDALNKLKLIKEGDTFKVNLGRNDEHDLYVINPPSQALLNELDETNFAVMAFDRLTKRKFTSYSNLMFKVTFLECSKISMFFLDAVTTAGFAYDATSQACFLGYGPLVDGVDEHLPSFIYTGQRLFANDTTGQQTISLDILTKDYSEFLYRVPEKVHDFNVCTKMCADSNRIRCVAIFLNTEQGICILANTNQLVDKQKMNEISEDDVLMTLYKMNPQEVFPKVKVYPDVTEDLVNQIETTPHQGFLSAGYACLDKSKASNGTQVCEAYVTCFKEGDIGASVSGFIHNYHNWQREASIEPSRPAPFTCKVYKREFMHPLAQIYDDNEYNYLKSGPTKGVVIGSTVGLLVGGFVIGAIIMILTK